MSLPATQPQPSPKPIAWRLATLLTGAAAVTAFFVIPLWPTPPLEPATHLFTFNGHRYEIVFVPVTHAEAVAQAEQRGGQLARIDTAAELRAVGNAAIAAKSGLIHLWAGRGTENIETSDVNYTLAIMPPVFEWSEFKPFTIAGGFVCKWERE